MSRKRDQGLPFNAVSMDGRSTTTRFADNKFAQLQNAATGKVYGRVRTITSVLVSSPVRICLDAHPVPADTNEMGAFAQALLALLATYGKSFIQLVMYDSGACSEANCEFVRQQGLHYLMCLKADQPTLLDEARLQLRLKTTAQALASSDEILSGEQVTRWLWLGFIPAGFHWKRSLTVVRVHKTTAHQKSGLVTAENHYYVSSLRRSDLNPGQWLLLIRRRRAVEGHNTLDKIMREDTRPWLLNPHGLLVLMMLRRAVYNILALYRCRTQRSDDRRHMPRRELIRELRLVLRTATAEHLAGLHLREVEEAAGVCPGVQSPVRVGEGGRRRTWSSAADPAGRKQAARVDLRLRAGQGQGARPPAAGEDHGRSSGDRFWGFGAPLASRGHGVYARLAPGQVDPEARSPEADLRLAGGLG